MTTQDKQYNQWQVNPNYHTKDSQLTDGIYYDGLSHQLEESLHQFRSSLVMDSSYPEQEPWMFGPPSLTYYTQIDLPVDKLGYNIRCGPFSPEQLTSYYKDTIYLPSSGQCKQPILKQYIGHIIGPQGQHLKTITENTGIHYLWYNENPLEKDTLPLWGCFQLWGHPKRLPYAVTQLNNHIKSVTQIFKTNI